jgi:type I restriction enzyme R subunit
VESRPEEADLFLADRNVLIDQTMVNDFRPFGGAMAKLSTKAKTIERSDGSEIDLTSRSTSERGELTQLTKSISASTRPSLGQTERQKIFKEFSSDFFDLIVIDECHRGSAAGRQRLA